MPAGGICFAFGGLWRAHSNRDSSHVESLQCCSARFGIGLDQQLIAGTGSVCYATAIVC